MIEHGFASPSLQLLMLPIDCLPLDALVQILCKLSHEELKPLLTVSKTFRSAALVAQQLHFDFSTPKPKKLVDFARSRDGTPHAPLLKLECRKPRTSKMSREEKRRIAVALFQAEKSNVSSSLCASTIQWSLT